MPPSSIALTLLLFTIVAPTTLLILYPCSWGRNSDIFCPGLDAINNSIMVPKANWNDARILRRNFQSLGSRSRINISSIQEIAKGTWRALICTDKNCVHAILVAQRSLQEEKPLETSALTWISWKEAKKMLVKGRVLAVSILKCYQVNLLFIIEEIVGPSDVRGVCPIGSYLYR